MDESEEVKTILFVHNPKTEESISLLVDGAVTIQGFTTCTINLAACLVVAEFCSIPCAGVFVPPLTAGAVWACLGCIAGAGYYCTTAYSQALNDSTANAYKAGILLVAAVGNSGDGNLSTDDVLYPAKFDSVIAVSAVDSNNIAPVWSADGAKIELAAPGVDIYSAWLNGGYANASGTSMAAPFVSGVAALIKSKNLSMTPQEIRHTLDYNAIDLGDPGRDRIYGFGLVQAG